MKNKETTAHTFARLANSDLLIHRDRNVRIECSRFLLVVLQRFDLNEEDGRDAFWALDLGELQKMVVALLFPRRLAFMAVDLHVSRDGPKIVVDELLQRHHAATNKVTVTERSDEKSLVVADSFGVPTWSVQCHRSPREEEASGQLREFRRPSREQSAQPIRTKITIGRQRRR